MMVGKKEGPLDVSRDQITKLVSDRMSRSVSFPRVLPLSP